MVTDRYSGYADEVTTRLGLVIDERMLAVREHQQSVDPSFHDLGLNVVTDDPLLGEHLGAGQVVSIRSLQRRSVAISTSANSTSLAFHRSGIRSAAFLAVIVKQNGQRQVEKSRDCITTVVPVIPALVDVRLPQIREDARPGVDTLRRDAAGGEVGRKTSSLLCGPANEDIGTAAQETAERFTSTVTKSLQKRHFNWCEPVVSVARPYTYFVPMEVRKSQSA